MGKLMKVQSADDVRVEKMLTINLCITSKYELLYEIRNMDKKFCFPEFQTLYQIVL